jgi:hypothetical protein
MAGVVRKYMEGFTRCGRWVGLTGFGKVGSGTGKETTKREVLNKLKDIQSHSLNMEEVILWLRKNQSSD